MSDGGDPGELTVFADPDVDAGDVDTPLEPILGEEPATSEAGGGDEAGLGEIDSPGVNEGSTPGVVDSSTPGVFDGGKGTPSNPIFAEEPETPEAEAGEVATEGEDTSDDSAAPVVGTSENGKGTSETDGPVFATFDDADEPGIPGTLLEPGALVEGPEAPGADGGDDPEATPSDGLL